jgi:hypothetical protein
LTDRFTKQPSRQTFWQKLQSFRITVSLSQFPWIGTEAWFDTDRGTESARYHLSIGATDCQAVKEYAANALDFLAFRRGVRFAPWH